MSQKLLSGTLVASGLNFVTSIPKGILAIGVSVVPCGKLYLRVGPTPPDCQFTIGFAGLHEVEGIIVK